MRITSKIYKNTEISWKFGSWGNRKEMRKVVESLLPKIVAKANGKRAWFYAVEEDGAKYVVVVETMKSLNDWGFCVVPEWFKPNSTDCPLKLLDSVDDMPESPWRPLVHRHHRSQGAVINPGDYVLICGRIHKVLDITKNGRYIVEDDNKNKHKVKKETICMMGVQS